MGLNLFLLRLASVGLTQSCRFRFLTTLNNLAGCRIYRKHGYRMVRTTHYFAQVTTFAAGFNNNGFFSTLIQHDRVRFRTVHDAQTATFLCNTFIIIHPRYVIHLKNLLIYK